jgi:peroxiredoxin Q/BCP
MITLPSQAPTIQIRNQDDESVSLQDLRGSWVVLFLYPKDNTSGCTKEACGFRDAHAELQALGVTVIGLSKDSPKSHQGFIQKQSLDFPLWSDQETKLIQELGAWKEKSMYGRTYMGIVRSTFVIDPTGTIVHVWDKVKPATHPQEVLEWMNNHLKSQ